MRDGIYWNIRSRILKTQERDRNRWEEWLSMIREGECSSMVVLKGKLMSGVKYAHIFQSKKGQGKGTLKEE